MSNIKDAESILGESGLAGQLSVRKIIYTTNAIETLHIQLRKIVKYRGHFPSDEAASKLLFLALRNIEKTGRCHPSRGNRRPINLPFYSASDSPMP
jgi:transposase-like protein